MIKSHAAPKAKKTPQKKKPERPNADAVWAMVKEITESQKENALQMKELRESQKENALQMKELRESQMETSLQMKETDRQIKEYNKRFGDFTNRFGEVVEYMIAPNLRQKFRELGHDFPSAGSNRSFSDDANGIYLEIDVLLENGGKAMLVEVKTKLTIDHVNGHIERLEKMRKYADLHGDNRSFLGAVAGVVMAPNVKSYALKQGLFVIEPSGETFSITPPLNKPKEW